MVLRGSRQERHGMRYLPEYQVWLQMKCRCHAPSGKGFKHYGARGIIVCDRWKTSFAAFIQDMGRRPGNGRKWQIERIDNNGNYEPSNCKWAGIKEQSRNKRCNRFFEHNGRSLILSDWATETRVSYELLKRRVLTAGWSITRAIETPVNAPRRNSHFLEFQGERLPLSDMARKYGIIPQSLMTRLRKGWSLEDALLTPIQEKQSKRNCRRTSDSKTAIAT